MPMIFQAIAVKIKSLLFFACLLYPSAVVFGQAPTEPAKNLSVSNMDGDQFFVSFTRGNGSRRIIIASTDPVTAVPVNGADYLAGNFGQGNEIAPGQFVVYNGTGSQTWLYGFNHSTTYHLRVFEYNGSNFSTEYLKDQFLEGSATTLTAPTIQASAITFSNVTGWGMTLSWTNGNGTARVLIAKADGQVDVEPVDLTNYSGGTAPFANGTNLGNGNFVQYSGTGNITSISGLEPGKTYHFALFEYKGSSGRVYLRPGTRASQSTMLYPTAPAINFSVNDANVDGDRFYYSFTNGNGSRRLVVAKKGGPVTAVPGDGESYTANTTFGLGDEIRPGEFVVSNGTSNGNWLYNLEPSTTYHLAIFEYNGTGMSTYYLRDSYLTGQRATLSPPTTQASNITFSNISGNSMTVGWTNGNGTGRVLVGKEGAPVDASPADFTNYGGGTGAFTNGSNLGNGNFVQYSGGASSTNITGLSPAKTYHFEVFEYTGSSSGRQYLRPGNKGSAQTVSAPTVPSANFSVNNANVDGDRFYYSFASGNGSRRIVVVKKGSPVTFRPEDGKTYAASTTLSQGEEVAEGEFVVYSGTSNGSWLYGLDPSSTYHLAIFEYNGTGDETFYLRDPYLAGERSTLFPPTQQASDLVFSNITGNSMTVSWKRGDGTGRILVGKAGSPVNAAPSDFTNYGGGSGSFTNGSNLGNGNYVQYSGSGTSTTITGLSPNVTYHFEVFEYTGSSSGRQYLRPGNRALQITGAAPTAASSGFSVNNANVDGDRFYYSFSEGNGARRVIFAKKGGPVTFLPTDGQAYASNTTFGSGAEVAPGEFVVYDGTSNGSWLYGLEPATEYHLAIFEYNGTGENSFYLRDFYLAASKSTLSPPSIQSSNAFTSSRSNNSINISWTRGDGANRILIGRKEGPVNVEPTDLANYPASSMFGVRQVGTGNYVLYSGSGNNINVTNLEPGTNYHFALFEFNGSSARLYLRPGYSFALETFGERPSVQVTNASYSNVDFTGMDVGFSKGNGTRRLVLARAGSAVNAGPADFTAYSASATFGQGDQIGSGNFVVYNGTEEGFALEGLEPGVTYHFAFYEYATSEQGDLYLAPPYTSSQSSKTSADIGVTGITSPISSCELGDAETVSIEITNFNAAPIGPFQVAYSLNGAAPVIEPISGTNTIAGNGKLSYTFQTKLDLSAEGNHELIAYTILEGDSNPSNDRFEISINSSAESDANVSPDVTICRGTPALLQASGGTSYRWSTGATTNLLEVAPLVSTEYRVTITTSNGCQIEKRVWVNVEEAGELPVISSEPDPESCEGGRVFSTQLDIPVHWYLDVDAEIFDLGESTTLKSDRSGNYIARYQNESGCEISSSPLLVEAAELPVLTVSGLTTICTGESLTLSVSGLRDLVWSTGESGESITVSPTGDTKYWVSGKYHADCHFSDTLEINVIPATAPAPVRQMLPTNGSLNLPQPISLSWTPGANSVVYDVFVWEEGSEKPIQPVAADIPQISYTARNLERGKAYLWQIHAKNSCFVTEGPVQRFVAAGLPDLLIQSYVAPEAVVAGNTLTVSWEVKNVGAGNTNNTRWKDRIWLSADLDLRKADDILLGTFDNPSSLMAGESYTMTQEVRIPINLRGVYYLFIITDNDDGYCTIENGVCVNERRSHTQTVSESDEQNNLIYQPISIGIPPLADLKVNQVGVTTDAFSGDSISVLYEVQNIGERDAKGLFWRFKRDNGQYSYSTGNAGGTSGGSGSFSAASAPTNVTVTESCRIEYFWRDAIYLSKEPIFDISKSTKIQEYSVFLAEEDPNSTCVTGDNVAVNASYTQQRELKLPDNVFGTYYLYIVSNFSGMFENDYSNNVRRSEPINVILRPPSDLEVADIQVPAEVIAGTNMKVSWTVENIGSNPPNVNSWVDEVFISDQPDFDRSRAISIFRKTFTTPLSFNEFGSSTPMPLETGDSYSAEAEALVPERLSGDYYVYLLTDSDNRVFEFDSKSNNVKRSTDTIKLITGDRAELTPVSISFPDTVYREAAFPLKWRIRNSGTRAAVGFTDRVYWSVSPNPTQQPITSLGSILHRDSLPAGQAVERTLLVNLPKNAPDSIYFHVFTDVFDNLFEVDETNNRASNQALGVHSPVVLTREAELVARQADLAATDLAVSNSSMGSGELLNINFTVENLGPDDVTDAFVTRVYLAKSSVLTEDDHYLTEFGRARLAVGEQYATGRAVKIPEWASGEYFVYLWVDYRGAVTEDRDKTNNIAVRKITVTPTPAPDLQITALSAPSEVISGEAFYVTYTVENKGEGSTRADWNDGFFLSTSPSLGTGAQNVGFKNVSVALAKGESLTDSALVKAPSNFSGNYFLIAKADYQNRVFEGLNGAELNNERNQILLVTISDPTDLEVSAFSTPESAYLGDETSAEIEVTNVGEKPASGRLFNGFYLSPDNQFDGAADPLVGTQDADVTILPGQSRTFTLKGPILDLAPGDYLGIGRTNLLASINEVNYQNNLMVAERALSLDVRSLPLDVPTSASLTAGTWRYYKVNVNANLDLLIDLSSNRTVGSNDVYVSFGKVPTPNEFDYQGILKNRTDQRVLIPETKSGTYYILVKTDIPLGQQVELLARALPLSILSSNPGAVGNGTVTTTLTGAGFKAGMEVSLLRNGAKVAGATHVNLTNSMSGSLTWRLGDVPFGVYDVEVKNPDGSRETLANGLEVEPSTGYGGLRYDILAPDVVRRGKTAFYNVVFRNEGNVDVPYVLAELTMEDDVVIYELKTQGKLKTNSTIDPLGRLADQPDYGFANGFLVLPLYGRDLRPGEEFSASLLLGNFTGNTFPMQVKSAGVSPSVLVLNLVEKIEATRQLALDNPEMFSSDRALVEDQVGFRHAMLHNYIDIGLITTSDTVGIDLGCFNCSLVPSDGSFDPETDKGIGTQFLGNATFGPGQYYHWDINKYGGVTGDNPGWDLVKISGNLAITATKNSPFTIKVNSLDYNNNPGYLAGWYPAVNKCWTIAVADKGITGFDPEKFEIDLTGFLAYNFIYNGQFSIKQLDEYTISLCFTAYVPGPGEVGVPGAPGGWGEDGSPGGPGGPGAPGVAPGSGGRGGIGGPGGGTRGPSGGNGGCPPGMDCTPDPDPNPEPNPDPNPDPDPNPEPNPDPDPSPDPGPNPKPAPQGKCPYLEGCGNDEVPEDSIGDCTHGVPGSPFGTPCPSPPGRPVVPPGGGGGGGGGPAPTGCAEGEGSGGAFASFRSSSYCGALFTGLGCGTAIAGCGVAVAAGCATVIGCLPGAVGCGLGLNGCVSSIMDMYNVRKQSEEAWFGGCVAGFFDPKKLNIAGGLIDVGICAGQSMVCKDVVSSCDPNEILGPEGYGDERFVSKEEELPFTIFFENDPVFATAPAQRVVVRQQLDPNLDPASFRLSGFGFQNMTFDVPAGLTNYTAKLSTASQIGVDVNVTFGLDPVNNELFWALQSVDPNTGLPPYEALAGFLPVNDSTARGEGFVSYTIKAGRETVTGDSLRAMANIFFDTNAPILTNEAFNTVDAVAPILLEIKDMLVEFDSLMSFTVIAEDDQGGSGVKGFDVFVSEDDGLYVLQSLDNPIGEKFVFQGTPGKNYCLAVVVTDQVDNRRRVSDEDVICFNTPEDAALSTTVYMLQSEVSGQGQINTLPGGSVFSESEEIQIEAVPAVGWAFVRWEGDVSGTDIRTQLTMDRDRQIRAVFVQGNLPAFAVTTPTEGNGTVTRDPAGSGYPAGTLVTFTATPAAGWEFVAWEGDESSLDPTITVAVDKEKNLKALFVEILSITLEGTPPTCPDAFDGMVKSHVSGGIAPYDYSWHTDGDVPVEGVNSINELKAGTYHLRVTDARGKTADQRVSIAAEDIQAPEVKVNEGVVVYLDAQGQGTLTVEMVDAGSTDNCSIATRTISKATFGCSNLGENEVMLTITDGSGNTSTARVNVQVRDTIPPVVLTVPVDSIVYATASSGYTLPDHINQVTTEDKCGAVEVTQSPAAGTSLAAGQAHTITFTAKDASRNETKAVFVVTVEALQIASVAALEMLEVPWNTPFNGLSLPHAVSATLNNGETANLPVTWEAFGFDPMESGIYSFSGTITVTDGLTNPAQVRAALTVLVLEKPAPQDLLLHVSQQKVHPDTPLATLETVDPVDDVHVYELTDQGSDNADFILDGNLLKWNSSQPVSGKPTYTIEVSTTDRAGNRLTKVFTFAVNWPTLDDLEVFSAFSPNGDGQNDTWGIPNLFGFQQVNITIVDRAGRIVFSTTNPTGRWDGTYQGKPLPAGTYIYVLETKDPSQRRSGTINLITR